MHGGLDHMTSASLIDVNSSIMDSLVARNKNKNAKKLRKRKL